MRHNRRWVRSKSTEKVLVLKKYAENFAVCIHMGIYSYKRVLGIEELSVLPGFLVHRREPGPI